MAAIKLRSCTLNGTPHHEESDVRNNAAIVATAVGDVMN
jgi:hypothetical protein